MPEKKIRHKRVRKTAAKKKRTAGKQTGTEFAAAYLKVNPKADYKEVAAAGKKKGIKIAPVTMGWARKAAGLGGRTANRKTSRKAVSSRRRARTLKGAGNFREEAAEKLREVASRAVLQGDDKTASQLLDMIRTLG